HGAKLDQFKSPSAQTHPFLDEEHGAGGIQLDRQRDQTEERSEHDQPDHRSQEADPTPERRSQSGLPEVLGEDKTARRERLDGELSGQPLIDLYAILDEDPSHPGLQELLDGKLATPFRHRDDDPVWAVPLDHLAKLVGVLRHAYHAAIRLSRELHDELASQRGCSLDEQALA